MSYQTVKNRSIVLLTSALLTTNSLSAKAESASGYRTFAFPKSAVGFIGVSGQRDSQLLAQGRMSFPKNIKLDLTVDRSPSLAFLKSFQRDDLDSLCVRNSDRLTDEEVGFISKLTGLQNLTIRNCDITDKSLAAICKLPNLRSLDLGGSLATSHGVQELRRLSKLKHLKLARNNLNDRSLSFLSRMPQLKLLSIQRCQITDEAIPFLKNLHNLTALDISDNKITDTGLSNLASAPLHLTVRQLWLNHCQISPTALKNISSFPRLASLHIQGYDAASLASLSTSKSLQKIDISGRRTTAQAAAPLSNLPRLRDLIVSANFDDEARIKSELGDCHLINRARMNQEVSLVFDAGSTLIQGFKGALPHFERLDDSKE